MITQMTYSTRYDDFDEWLDGCKDAGLDLSDIISDVPTEYSFTVDVDGHVVAYWDREKKFGSIVNNEMM